MIVYFQDLIILGEISAEGNLVIFVIEINEIICLAENVNVLNYFLALCLHEVIRAVFS